MDIDQLAFGTEKCMRTDPCSTNDLSPQGAVHQILSSSEFQSFMLASARVMGVGGWFAADSMLLCGRNMGFLQDHKFVASFQRALDRYEIPAKKKQLEQLIWRKHVLASVAKNCTRLDGDFMECGVEYGFGVDVVSHYIDFQSLSKGWWLCDTFSGVPGDQLDTGTNPNPDFIDSGQFDAVVRKFAYCKNFKVVKGCLPDALIHGMPEKIAFLHVDMNNSYAEVSTLLQLIDRVVIGGHIVLDDYGWTAFARQHTCECELFRQLGLEVTELPTGQGLVIKTFETNSSAIQIDPILNDCSTYAVRLNAWPGSSRHPFDPIALAEFQSAFEYLQQQIKAIENMLENPGSLARNAISEESFSAVQCAQLFKVRESQPGLLAITCPDTLETFNLTVARNVLQRHIDVMQRIIDSCILLQEEGTRD